MTTPPPRAVRRRVVAIHQRFAALVGADHIGTRYACHGLAWWLARRRPARVLEIGAGIGTLSAVIAAAAPDAERYAVEDDAWCRARWAENIPAASATLLGDFKVGDVPDGWDFVVIDGGDKRSDYYEALRPRAVAFVEGRRPGQRASLDQVWTGRRGFVHASWKPLDRSKGFSVYQFDPTAREAVWLATVRERERVLDGLARRLGVSVGKRRMPQETA